MKPINVVGPRGDVSNAEQLREKLEGFAARLSKHGLPVATQGLLRDGLADEHAALVVYCLDGWRDSKELGLIVDAFENARKPVWRFLPGGSKTGAELADSIRGSLGELREVEPVVKDSLTTDARTREEVACND